MDDDEDDHGYAEFIGFRTTAGTANERLVQLGFGDASLVSLYHASYQTLQSAAADTLDYAVESGYEEIDPVELPDRVQGYLGWGAPPEGQRDLDVFRDWVTSHRAAAGPARTVWEYIDAWYSAVQRTTWQTAPAVLRWLAFFEEDNYLENPEIVETCFFTVLMGIVSSKDDVTLDLADIIGSYFAGETEQEWCDEAIRLLAELPVNLALKVSRYQDFFRSITESEPWARERYTKLQLGSELQALPKAVSAHEKGTSFERIVEFVFGSEPGFEVASRRYDLGDEEIDLVLRNNVQRPFWIALHSPHIFIECKNWSRPVGSSEYRDFQGKLENQGALVQVGLFFAASGFTSEFQNAALRASRSAVTIVTATLHDIERYATGNERLTAWLEDLISRSL